VGEVTGVTVSWSPTSVGQLAPRWQRLSARVSGLELKGVARLLDSLLGGVVGFVVFAPFVVLGLLILGSRDDAAVTAMLAGAFLLLLVLLVALAGLLVLVPFRRGAYLSTSGLLVRRRIFRPSTTIPWSDLTSACLLPHDAGSASIEQVSMLRTTGEAIGLPSIARPIAPQHEGPDEQRPNRAFFVHRSLPDLVDALNALIPAATFVAHLRGRVPEEAFIRAVPGYASGPDLLVIAGDVPPGATPDSVARDLESLGASSGASSSEWASWSGVGPGGSFSVEVGPLAELLDASPDTVHRALQRPLRHHDLHRCTAVAIAVG